MSNMLKRILVMLLVLVSVFTITSCDEDDGVDPIKFSFFLDQFKGGFGDGSGYNDHAQAGSPYHSVKTEVETYNGQTSVYDASEDTYTYVPYTTTTTKIYNTDGLITSSESTTTSTTSTYKTSRTDCEYDGNEGTSITKKDDAISGKSEFTMNDDKKVLTEKYYTTYDKGITFILSSEITYTYNSDGRLSEKKYTGYYTESDGSNKAGDVRYNSTESYTYFKSDLPLEYVNEEKYYDAGAVYETYTCKDTYINDGKIITAYNHEYKYVEEDYTSEGNTSCTFTYDADGNVQIAQEVQNYSSYTKTYITTYTWEKDLIKEYITTAQKSTDAAAKNEEKYTYTYDSKGKITSDNYFLATDGVLDTNPFRSKTYTYE